MQLDTNLPDKLIQELSRNFTRDFREKLFAEITIAIKPEIDNYVDEIAKALQPRINASYEMAARLLMVEITTKRIA